MTTPTPATSSPATSTAGTTPSSSRSTSSSKGLNRDVVAQISEMKNEPQWMRDFRLRVARDLRVEADADGLLGRQHPELPARLQRHLLLRQADGGPGQDLGGRARTRSSAPSTSSASRRRSASSSPASAPSTTPRSSTTRSARTSRSSACIFLDMDSGLREHPDIVQRVLRHHRPAGGQQVRRAELAPSGRAAASSTCPPGVKVDIPLQAYFRINTENMGQFERTLIIAEEGSYVHYVEGCTAPTYSQRLAAQRRRRDHRQEGRPRPLHDDPELVDQRLQPGDQARRGLRGRRHGVGRRQPRLASSR